MGGSNVCISACGYPFVIGSNIVGLHEYKVHRFLAEITFAECHVL